MRTPLTTRLAAGLLLAVSALARAEGEGPATPTTAPPAALEVPERVYDAGKVDRGTVLKHSFTLENRGPTELSIDAKPGWGCTLTEFDKVIPPGGVGKVTASIDTAHYRGALGKTVRVTANDPARTSVTLELRAQVVSLIDVSPTETPPLRMTWGEPKPTELTLQSTDKQPFDVLAVEADPKLTVTVRSRPGAASPKRKATKPGARKPIASGSSRYLVAITPKKDVPVGQSVLNVTLTTDRVRAEKIAIRPVLSVVGLVQVFPAHIMLKPSPDGAMPAIRIRKPSGSPLRILGVESADPDFSPTVTPVENGREFDLHVKYTGKQGRGPVRSRLTVKTNDRSQPTIVVPMIGTL